MALYYGAAGNRQWNVRLEKLVPGSALALLCCIVAPPQAKLTFGLWVNLDGSTILNSQTQLQWLAAGTLAGTLGGQMSVSNAISTASWRLQACRLVGRYIKRRQRGSKASGSYQQMPDSWRIRLRKKTDDHEILASGLWQDKRRSFVQTWSAVCGDYCIYLRPLYSRVIRNIANLRRQ